MSSVKSAMPDPIAADPTVRLSQDQLLGIGRKSDVYLWQPGQAVKLFHPGVPLEEIEAEYRRHTVIHDLGIPAPAALGRCRCDGREGIVFERAGETTLLQKNLRNPLLLFATAAEMARLHATTLSFHTDELPPIKDLVLEIAGGLPPEVIPFPHVLTAYLAGLPDDNAVCHLDFHPDNVMVRGHETLVIDWALAARGPAAADVAFTSLLLTLGDPPPGTSAFGLKLIAFCRDLLYRHYRKKVQRLTGLDDAQIDPWRLPICILRLGLWGLDSEREYLGRSIRQALDDLATHAPTAAGQADPGA